MIALDTNILLRFLVADDPQQAEIARKLVVNSDGIYISKTVLMELEWVLRSVYEHAPKPLHAGLTGLLGLANVTVECVDQVAQAMQDYQAGMDFSDALHAASSQAEAGLYTFDKKFVKKAVSLGRDVRLAKAGVAGRSH